MKTIDSVLFLTSLSLSLSVLAQTESGLELRFKGTVVDSGGKPVDGAVVECYGFPRDPSTGDLENEPIKRVIATNGLVELAVAPDRSTLIARKQGYAPYWRSFFAGLEPEGKLTLGEPGALSGKVVDENDTPVANAEVFVGLATMVTEVGLGSRSMGYLFGKPAHDLFNARTSSDGTFTIKDFPKDATAELMVQVPGKAVRREPRETLGSSSLTWRHGDTDIRLVLEPAGSVEGNVVASQPDQSLPIATVRLTPERGGFFGFGQTGPVSSRESGSFVIPDVPAGSYRLRVSFGTNAVPDWVAETMPVSVETGQTTKDVAIKAVRGGVLAVAVLDRKERKPMSKVAVSAYRQGQQFGAVSDAQGIAYVRVLPGEYQVSAMRESARPETLTATVEEGQTNRVDLELAPPMRTKGIVRRPDGQPAPGVEVRIVGGPGSFRTPLKTDSEGKFDLPFTMQSSMQGVPCLLVRDTEHNLAYAQDVDEDTEPLDVKLGPAITLSGRAESEGAPVTNVSVALIFWTGRSGMHLPGMTVGTNTSGTYEIPALPPGRKYGVYVTAPGFGTKSIFSVPSDGEGKVELDPVELRKASLTLAGQVVDTDDKPVSGANVYMTGEGQPSANATTDRQGRFTFSSVCEGSVRLMANARNMNASVSAEGGDTNVIVKLGQSQAMYASSSSSKTFRLKGTVTDPDGQPVSGAWVRVFPAETSSSKTASNGSFSLSWNLQPWQMQQGGDQWLVVRDVARNLAVAETVSEDTTNLNVALKPGLTVSGKVEGPDGSALPKAEIELFLMAGRSYNSFDQQPVRTDSNGLFSIEALPAGPKYIMYASANNYGRSRQEFGQETETNRLELPAFSLKLADQIVAGQVLNQQDKPASGVQVSLNGDDQPTGTATTDREGRFKFKVCEGQVQLFANADNSYGNITASSGDTNVVLQLRGYNMAERIAPTRVSLKGKPLPDLAEFGLTAESRPAGKPLLLCLIDAEQRPCRRSVRLLTEQHQALCQKGIAVLALQAVPVSAETIQTWTNSAPLPFALGCVKEKSAKTKWATDVQSLPWLILCDSKGNVMEEGFSVDDLPAKLNALGE